MSRGFDYSVTLVDGENLVPAHHAALLLNMQAAVENWTRYITGLGSVEVELVIHHADRAGGTSATSADIGTSNGRTIYRDSVAHELITGIDLNGDAADAIITVGAEYLQQWLWFDPDPFKRTASVPFDKNDAVSVLMHEFGHALGMNGWKGADGTLPGNYQSVYDSHIVIRDGNPFFTGPAVEALYGGLLPLSNPLVDQNTVHHYGHEPEDMLDYALMEGNTFYFTGRRYYIDNIDLALMQDLGLPTSGRAESEFADYLTGFGQNDSFSAGAGNDTLSGGAGNDRLNGGEGFDAAIYGGGRSNYSVVLNTDGSLTVSDMRAGGDGSDILLAVEALWFADGVFTIDELLRPPVVTPPTNVETTTSLTLPEGVLNVLASGNGNVRLTGNALNNSITGNKGKNVINGAGGNDTLMGGSGKDAFLFTTKLGTSKTDRKVNFDTLKDFSAKDDSLYLDNAIFKKLGKKGSEQKPVKLDKKFFTVGDKAKDKDDYIVYNKKTGVLSYDADGSGKGQAVEFALLKNKATLKVDDFFVI